MKPREWILKRQAELMREHGVEESPHHPAVLQGSAIIDWLEMTFGRGDTEPTGLLPPAESEATP